jgi:protocatechuate 3,4-dioxygenase beta subunit
VFKAAGDAKARDLLSTDFAPLKESKVGELAAKFDIVLGYTPQA